MRLSVKMLVRGVLSYGKYLQGKYFLATITHPFWLLLRAQLENKILWGKNCLRLILCLKLPNVSPSPKHTCNCNPPLPTGWVSTKQHTRQILKGFCLPRFIRELLCPAGTSSLKIHFPSYMFYTKSKDSHCNKEKHLLNWTLWVSTIG